MRLKRRKCESSIFRKEPEIEANEFCVEKVIVLPAGEYESFTKHLMHDYDFIRDNVDLMCEKMVCGTAC